MYLEPLELSKCSNRCLQLLDVLNLDGRNLLDDGVNILRANLVEQTCQVPKKQVSTTFVHL